MKSNHITIVVEVKYNDGPPMYCSGLVQAFDGSPLPPDERVADIMLNDIRKAFIDAIGKVRKVEGV